LLNTTKKKEGNREMQHLGSFHTFFYTFIKTNAIPTVFGGISKFNNDVQDAGKIVADNAFATDILLRPNFRFALNIISKKLPLHPVYSGCFH
jgi:hypothetical protein